MKEATKKCKYCRSEIDAKAKVCPVCGRAQKSHGCLGVFLALVILVGAGIGLGSSVISQPASVGDEYITLDEYNQIQVGMTYEEVQEIVGSAGTVSAETSMAGIHTFIVTWYGNPTIGTNANVTFQNDAVVGKAQAGLQ